MLNFLSINKSQKKETKGNPKFITTADGIYEMIKSICDEQIPLSISWEGADQEEQTYLLRVGTELFITDRLDSAEAHESLLSAKNFKAQAKIDGVDVTFNVNLPSNSEKEDCNYYKAALPEKIYYPQRRNKFRAIIPEDSRIPFIAKFGLNETQLTGELLDLSIDGLGVMLDSHVFARKGEKIRACTISPPNEHVITFDIEVRSTRPCERDSRMMRLGARIINLNRKTLKQLRKMTLSLEDIEKKRKKEQKKK